MPELTKTPGGVGPRGGSNQLGWQALAGHPSPWAMPDERPLVRLAVVRHRGRSVTVALFDTGDEALTQLMLWRLPRLMSVRVERAAQGAAYPGDCRARLRAELRHRGIRVRG